ncbi:MAG TPA: hypothetical protein VGX68_27975 [Thermoanaerobaculia bacterium]|nr:hypothetical protein [Thermoanaerobaculia bacterium]
MTRCDRFETEAVHLLEQGLPLDEHFSSCPDCLAARAAYERLGERVSALSGDEEPPPGWEARVWQRIEDRRRSRHRWGPWWVVPVAVAALAAFLFVRIPGQGPPSLRVEVEPGTTVRRGLEAQPGDRLQLKATTGGVDYCELRVYRNDAELILRCSTEPPCSRRGRELRASVALDGIGRYQPLLLFSKRPLPASASDLQTDTGAALAAGADVELGSEIVVR